LLALHAAWALDHSLHVWAEDAAAFEAHRRRRARQTSKARPHPWTAPAEAVARALADAGPGAESLVGGARPSRLTFWLPGDTGCPWPSPTIAAVTPVTGGVPAVLRPWTVPTLAFDARSATRLLLARLDRSEGVPGDASLAYLATAVLFALELLSRGRFAPGLVPTHDGRGCEARWLPVPGTADGARLRALALAMPSACRAEATAPFDRRGRGAADVLGQVVTDVVDSVARASGAPRLTPRPAVRSKRATPLASMLDALVTATPAALPDSPEVRALVGTVAAWRGRATIGEPGFRTCFRVVPPEDGAGGSAEQAWSLEVLLQATDDPSLLVPAADAWKSARRLVAFGRRLDDPQERLLADLGRATRLHPPLDPMLRQAHPAGLHLDVAGAYAFLREGAPVLADAGFGIQLPSWWQAGRPRVASRLRATTRTSSGESAADARLGLDAIVDYRWELAIGDTTVTAEEIRELARLKVPLVRVRGQWVELRPEDVNAAVGLVERAGQAAGTMTAGDVLRTGLGLGVSDGGLPVNGVTADGWLGTFLAGGGSGGLPEAGGTPKGFVGTLRPYQERGLAWLEFLGGHGLGACLADDMGLGKTAQVLALLVAERAARTADAAMAHDTSGPTLVVCPMSVVENWRREAERFAPDLAVHVHHGSERLEGEDLATAASQADLVVTTYGLVTRDVEALSAIGWGRLVLDEAQNIKNSAARQTEAVRRIRAHRRIALTGTPVENRLAELWSIMEVLNPGLLGSANAFRQRFAVPIERYGDDEAAGRLRRATAPFILRRLKSDRSIIADLPEKLEMTVYCSLTREQASLYQAVVDEMMERIESSDGIERRGLVLATMLRLKQVCNHPAQMLRDGSPLAGRSGKLERVEEILEEVLAEGDRALLFTQFAEFGELLRTHLRDRFEQEILYLHGGTRKADRDAMVARFQGENGPPILVLSLKAGGTGLNLTAANHVIHVDRWWNPAVEDQATDRAYRIGQRRDVQVRKLVCAGTLEDRIAAMLETKRALAERVVGSGETWLTELSNAELRDLVALSADAVAEG
jgi:SNF2-related domain/SNF2 Helicase protein/Helicase conserved C-terminal domain